MVHAPDEETHFNTLREVFTRLRDAGLSIKLSKCKFGLKEVEYLGYTVSSKGILPSKRKVAALVDFKPPRSQKELLHFLGALGYFRSSLKGIKKEGKYNNPSEIMQVLFSLATCKLPPKTKFEEIYGQNPRSLRRLQAYANKCNNANSPGPSGTTRSVHRRLGLCHWRIAGATWSGWSLAPTRCVQPSSWSRQAKMEYVSERAVCMCAVPSSFPS